MRTTCLVSALFAVLAGELCASSTALAQDAPPASAGADAATPAGDADVAEAADPAASGEPADAPSAEELAAAEAEADAQMATEAASFSKAPKKGLAVIWGVVSDAVEHDTLPEAQVSVIGTKYKALADFDGRYRLELPPGTYTLRVYFEMHRPSVVKNVAVKVGEVEQVDVAVLPDEQAIETVEIEADVDRASLEGQLLTRQRSAAVGDGVGRAEIARTPASNAAQATQRLVGATIVGNRFVYVRGLGERYTNSLLNGTPLPSPEPDRAAVPLDLFPSLILESVTIVKTFTPDVPADFAGGSVRIETRELPSRPLFQLSLSGGFDSRATFRDRLSHPGSNTDWLGFDGGKRSLPDGFPDYVLQPGLPKPGHVKEECAANPQACIAKEDLVRAAKQINSSMHPRTSFTPPNYSLSAVAGNGWDLGGERRLGVLASVNYGRSFRQREYTLRTFEIAPDPSTGAERLERDRDLRGQQGEDKVSWGALASLSYWASPRHRYSLTALHTQLADAETSAINGTYLEYGGAQVAAARLRYVSRALDFAQFRGEDDFNALNHAKLAWHGAYSVASRDEPDTRTTVYQYNDTSNLWNALGTTANGTHLFANQHEKQLGAGVDWTQPVSADPEEYKVKLGSLVSRRDRDFSARRFWFNKTRGTAEGALFSCEGPGYPLDCPEKLYRYDQIGAAITPSEVTFPDDAYEAELDIYAGYLMLDANLGKQVRLVGGARVERTHQTITPYSQFTGGTASAGAAIDSTDLLPALSLTYSATKKTKLRAALSRTLARPQIRELAPFVYADYFGSRTVSGNPELELTYIQNADLRFEVFPTPREVLAFSLFYKLFDAPIEPFVTGNGLVSYQNAAGARLIGVELEARKDLGFVSVALTDLSVIANLTLAHSQIEIDDEQGVRGTSVTNLDRPMVNQAPWVVNFAIDYANERLGLNVRGLLNVVGPRITQVGTGGVDDEYEQPQPKLDFTASKQFGKNVSLKLNATNLINAPWVRTLGKSRSASRETYREHEGRLFTVTGTYTY